MAHIPQSPNPYSEPSWDRHCAEFATEGLEDFWNDLGGCPRSWREAAALYRRLGVTNLKDAATAVLGEPVSPALAMRGDVVMVDGALGICRGEWVECLDRMQPIRRAECAWRITNNPPRGS